jgi:hypothetical protein
MKIFHTFVILFLVFIQVVYSEEINPTLTIKIPMRDGKELTTDLYLPTPDAQGLPCILLRSPAGRDATHWKPFAQIAHAGYVIAIQDTRSALDEDGKTLPFMSDGWGKLQDGYDTVEWLAKSPYTNGKIGTWGSSALGITQLLMAPSQPPHLVCQYMMMSAASLYHHCLFPGGQLLKNQVEGWLGLYARDSGVLHYVSHRPFYNEFWKQLNAVDVSHQVKVPGLHLGGWYDTFLQGTLDGYLSRQNAGGEGAKGTQKLVLGPWTHFWPASQELGDFCIPEGGNQPPYDISPKTWFDHYLKGIDNGIEKIPNVIYYVMGPFDGSPSSGNRWKTSNVWPVPATSTTYYLAENKSLEQVIPVDGKSPYLYDPCRPVETKGGHNLFLKSGPVDQQSIENRSDILVFTTPILQEDVEVTGNIKAKLFFTTDQADTDMIVHLCDVYPGGRSILISEGGYRLATMQKNKSDLSQPIEAEIDLWATSIVFAKGHSMRVTVSSSNYPRYEKNVNIGLFGCHSGKCRVARNTLFTGSKYPSQIILPIVKK